MTTYETIYISAPTLTDDEAETLVSGYAEVVTSGGGALYANEKIGRRRLAYPIKKFEDGIYARLLYGSDASVPRELERRMRLSDKVLRFLTVKLDEEWAAASREQAVRDEQARKEAAKAAQEEAARREVAEAEASQEAGTRRAEATAEEPTPRAPEDASGGQAESRASDGQG